MQVPLELKVIVGKLGHSLRITLPKPMTDQLGIKKGDTVGLSLTDGEITLRKLEKS
jgi:AbrB family looped-hinge helix DNA binding protein